MKVSKSIVLGLAVLFVGTACSKQNSSFSGSNAKSRVIDTAKDGKEASKELSALPGFDKIYAEETEKYLDTSMDEILEGALAKIEKAFGNEPVTINGVDYDDPAGRMTEVVEMIQDSSFDPYASPREIMEELELSVDLTDKKAVDSYLKDEEGTLQDLRDTLAEIDPTSFVITGPEGSSSESEESFSLVQYAGTAYSAAVACVQGVCQAQTATSNNAASSAVWPANQSQQVATAQAQAAAQAQAKKKAADQAAANAIYNPANQAQLAQQTQTVVGGFATAFSSATQAVGMFSAGVNMSNKAALDPTFAANMAAGVGGANFAANLDKANGLASTNANAQVLEMYSTLGLIYQQ